MNKLFQIEELEVLDENVKEPLTDGVKHEQESKSAFDRFLLPCMVALSVIFLIFGLVSKISESKALGASISAYATPSPTVSAKPAPTPTVAPTATPTITPTATPTIAPTVAPTATAKALIVVDAGHGGFDPGTAASVSGTYEKDINLPIAQCLKQYLVEAGYEVIMTRETNDALGASKDEDMNYRSTLISQSGADMFISIHQNAFPANPDVHGPEIYYHPNSTVGKVFAQYVLKHLDILAKTEITRGVKSADYTVIRYVPYSILIECGFVTNPTEEQNLISADYQKQLAQAIVAGVNELYDTGVFN